MVDITLHGILGKKLGKHWSLNVESIFEIFEAIEANTDNLSKYFRDLKKFISHFIVYVDGKIIKSHLLKSKILNPGNNVEILPIIQGSGVVLPNLLIGLALMALSFVVTMLLSPKAPKDVKTSSSVLGGIKNVVNRNIVIPVGYGRLRVGSAVISNDMNVSRKPPVIITPNNNNIAAIARGSYYSSVDISLTDEQIRERFGSVRHP